MEFYYVNSQNKKIDLSTYPYMFQSGDLLNFSKTYASTSTSAGARISEFGRKLKEIPLKIAIMPEYGVSKAEKQELFNKYVNDLYEIFETDIINNISGKLYTAGGQYINCFIIESKKSQLDIGKEFMFNELTLLIPDPVWISEKKHIFKSADITSTNNMRYPNRYAFRYANGLTNTSITNEHFTDCGFRLIIYGPVVKPQIVIGGYPYYVDLILEAGEYLEVDSAANAITKVMNNGIRVNCFHNRDKANNVFRKIPSGKLNIDWSGKFDFDLTLYEERSEPKW